MEGEIIGNIHILVGPSQSGKLSAVKFATCNT